MRGTPAFGSPPERTSICSSNRRPRRWHRVPKRAASFAQATSPGCRKRRRSRCHAGGGGGGAPQASRAGGRHGGGDATAAVARASGGAAGAVGTGRGPSVPIPTAAADGASTPEAHAVASAEGLAARVVEWEDSFPLWVAPTYLRMATQAANNRCGAGLRARVLARARLEAQAVGHLGRGAWRRRHGLRWQLRALRWAVAEPGRRVRAKGWQVAQTTPPHLPGPHRRRVARARAIAFARRPRPQCAGATAPRVPPQACPGGERRAFKMRIAPRAQRKVCLLDHKHHRPRAAGDPNCRRAPP